MCVASVITSIMSHLHDVSAATGQTQTLYNSMVGRYQELEDRVANATKQLQSIPDIVQQTENDISAANSSINLAEQAINERMSLIINITEHKDRAVSELSSASGCFTSLRNQLDSAREAAASVRCL